MRSEQYIQSLGEYLKLYFQITRKNRKDYREYKATCRKK